MEAYKIRSIRRRVKIAGSKKTFDKFIKQGEPDKVKAFLEFLLKYPKLKIFGGPCDGYCGGFGEPLEGFRVYIDQVRRKIAPLEKGYGDLFGQKHDWFKLLL